MSVPSFGRAWNEYLLCMVRVNKCYKDFSQKGLGLSLTTKLYDKLQGNAGTWWTQSDLSAWGCWKFFPPSQNTTNTSLVVYSTRACTHTHTHKTKIPRTKYIFLQKHKMRHEQSMCVFIPSTMQQLSCFSLPLHGHPQVFWTVQTATLHLIASSLHSLYCYRTIRFQIKFR
jgi:hypothetical protein